MLLEPQHFHMSQNCGLEGKGMLFMEIFPMRMSSVLLQVKFMVSNVLKVVFVARASALPHVSKLWFGRQGHALYRNILPEDVISFVANNIYGVKGVVAMLNPAIISYWG